MRYDTFAVLIHFNFNSKAMHDVLVLVNRECCGDLRVSLQEICFKDVKVLLFKVSLAKKKIELILWVTDDNEINNGISNQFFNQI